MKFFSVSAVFRANTFVLLLLLTILINPHPATSDTNLENGDAQTLQSANERINEPRSSSGNQPNQEQTNQEFLNAFILQLSTMNTNMVKCLTNFTLKEFHILIRPSLYGIFILWFSWLLIYFDSKIPGVYPPSPISPKKHRNVSGHTFHLNYAIGLINGLMTFCLILWQQLS